MVLNLSYVASIKTAKFQISGRKNVRVELEPRVSYSFDIKIVSRKNSLKVLVSPQAHFR